MTLYAVFQEGVYRHGCLGIFDNLQVAQTIAYDAAHNMGDDGYHEYQVVPFEMNKSYAENGKRWLNVHEEPAIYIAQGERKRVW